MTILEMERLCQQAAVHRGDEERTRCEYCGDVWPNDAMVVTGSHWLCKQCQNDGNALEALNKALEEELEVFCCASQEVDRIRKLAESYHAPLRRD